MFRRVDNDRVRRRKAAQVFLACKQAKRPQPLPAFELFDAEDPLQMTLDISHNSRDLDWMRQEHIETFKRRIYALCGDLVEVRKSIRHLSRPLALVTTVQFIHRTVKEFLDSATFTLLLEERTGDQYDWEAFLCMMNLYLLKRWRAHADVAGHVREWHEDFLGHARNLDDRRCELVVPLLQDFFHVVKPGLGSSGAVVGARLPFAYPDFEAFLSALKQQGFSMSVEQLAALCNGTSAHQPLIESNDSVATIKGPIDEIEATGVQIREVTMKDVSIGDLMIREKEVTGQGWRKKTIAWLSCVWWRIPNTHNGSGRTSEASEEDKDDDFETASSGWDQQD
jgi:hypothetical protein